MADAGVGDLDQYLALLRRGDVNFNDLQGFSSLKGNSGAGFHGVLSGGVGGRAAA